MSTLVHDVKFAARMLARHPGFTVTAIIALALGIGANTAIFTVVNSLLLRPLPYAKADRLVMVYEKNRARSGRDRNVISPANFRDWQNRNHVFSDMSAVVSTLLNLSGTGDPEEIAGESVTPSFFNVLGVHPAMGRSFTVEESRPNGPDLAVISHSLWQRRFGGRQDIVGQKATLSARPYTIIGVMPAGFRFYNREAEIWVPLRLDPARNYRVGSGRYMNAVARLRDGVSQEQAQSEMTAIATSLEREFPSFNTNWSVNVVRLRDAFVGDVRLAVYVLLAAVGFVLLIACANVANLLLARAQTRRREIAIRASLGAGRGHIVRQLLTESALLGLTAGFAGIVVAIWGVDALVAFSPKNLPMRESIRPDYIVFGFNILLSIFTGVLFGLAPALSAGRTDLNIALRQGGRSSTAAPHRLRGVLVVAEVALGLVLLAGAGLLIRSFSKLQAVDPGFKPDGLLTMRVVLPGTKYQQPEQKISFFERALERVRAVPGVESASAVSFLPLQGLGSATNYRVVGRPEPPHGQEPGAGVSTVEPAFFQTMGVQLVKGRLFDRRDTAKAPRTYVVSESLVRQSFPDQDPIGQRLVVSMGDDIPGEIVGVVRDIRAGSLDEVPRPRVYYTHGHLAYGFMTFVIRTHGDPMGLASAASNAIRSLDSELPVSQVKPMESVVAESVARARFTTLLLTVFAGLALLLAAVGIYGVISYGVTERTQEIGLRMALGAGRVSVLSMVLRQSFGLVAIGIVFGVGASLALTRVMTSLLYNVSATDPLTFLSVVLILVAVTLAASLIPARRAATVDPMIALRYE